MSDLNKRKQNANADSIWRHAKPPATKRPWVIRHTLWCGTASHVGTLSTVVSVQPIAAQPKLAPSTQSRERAILTCVQGEVAES